MASSSSSMGSDTLNLFPVNEKLARNNFPLWKAQVLAVLRGAQMAGFLDGTNKAPLATIKVVSIPSAIGVSQAIERMFSSQCCARVINTSMTLAITQKGNKLVAEYVAKKFGLADEMALAGKKLEDEDLVSYILAGLDEDFNPLVTSITTRVEPITVGELYSQMIRFEQCMDLLHGSAQSFINYVSRGHGGGEAPHGGSHGRSRSGENIPSSDAPVVECQQCGKCGHMVVKCFKLFDTSFTGKERSAAAATNSYGIHTNWHTDTGTTQPHHRRT
ncbi:hypothetical protein U9M48_043442 [Paspalum notatum var. saurae]|uniref:CCHC-type domain-containing protein n=1 Tax=Paspalum notatum var. saurae TaxID=547442 RepID=A0AAQ3XHD4_PASNO